MATIKVSNSKSNVKNIITYITKDEKTNKNLIGSLNCNVDSASIEMNLTKKMWLKTGNRTYFHIIQSFHKDDNISHQKAFDIATELVNTYNGFNDFEVLFATHSDKEHIHSHFIINSVNFKTGYKYQMSPHDLQDIKNLSDDLCTKYNLHICQKNKTFNNSDREELSSFNKNTYHVLKQAQDDSSNTTNSYIHNIALAIINCKSISTSKQDFISKLNDLDISVKWADNLKYITFTDLNSTNQKCKVRNKRLEQYYNLDLSKEALLNEFEKNRERIKTRERLSGQYDKNSGTTITSPEEAEPKKDSIAEQLRKASQTPREKTEPAIKNKSNYYER